MIRRLISNDCQETALIHAQSMSHEFLPSFGTSFLKLLHRKLLEDPDIVGYGHFRNGKLSGFVIGSRNSSQTLKRTFKRGFISFLPWVLRKMITSPKTIIYLWETVFFSQKEKLPFQGELLVIAVDADFRRLKIGSRLFKALTASFKKNGIRSFKIGTLKINKSANIFYQKLGGIYVTSFSLYNKIWNVYVFYV